MEGRFDYITDPKTIVSLGCFLFSLGGVYANLKAKDKAHDEKIQELKDEMGTLKEKIKEINAEEIKASLIRMETNLDRVVVAIKDLQAKKK